MRKNRIISMMLSVCLLISMVIPVTATAEDNIIITVPAVGGTVGSDIVVPVKITNNIGILGATLKIEFPPELTLTDAVNGEAFSDLLMTEPGNLTSPCKFIWDGASLDSVSDGAILYLTFTINDFANEGDNYNIKLSYDNGDIVVLDNSAPMGIREVYPTVNEGSVKVLDYIPGDFDCNNKVNATDIVWARRYLAGGFELPIINELAGDVDASGKVNTTDLIFMRRYVAGGYGTALLPGKKVCNHSLELIAEYKEPTQTEDGSIEYWQCTKCKKYFSDWKGINEVKLEDTVLKYTAPNPKIDEAIGFLKSLNVASGYEDGTFRPMLKMTKAEAVRWVVSALNLEEKADTKTVFDDVNEQASWAAGYVNVGIDYGFIDVTADKKFNPLTNVTYEELIKMLVKVTGYDDYAKKKGYIQAAAKAGIAKDISLDSSDELTRGNVALLLWNAMKAPMYDDLSSVVMNGENGNDFQTILSENWNAYLFDAQITTKNLLSAGTVKMNYLTGADYAADYENLVKNIGINKPVKGKIYIGDTDADERLCQSVKVLAKYDGDWNLIHLVKTSKIKSAAFDGKAVDSSTTLEQIVIKDGKSTVMYDLTDDCRIYVNGVLVTDIDAGKLFDYIVESSGDVVLYESDNGEYDAVVMNCYLTAEIDEVKDFGNEVRVTLTSLSGFGSAEAGDRFTISEDRLVKIVRNGERTEADSLKKGDVVSLLYDGKNLNKSEFLTVLATDETMTGKLEACDLGERIYTVSKKDYYAVGNLDNANVGTVYTFKLDVFGNLFAAGDEVRTEVVTTTAKKIVEDLPSEVVGFRIYGRKRVDGVADGNYQMVGDPVKVGGADKYRVTVRCSGKNLLYLSDKATNEDSMFHRLDQSNGTAVMGLESNTRYFISYNCKQTTNMNGSTINKFIGATWFGHWWVYWDNTTERWAIFNGQATAGTSNWTEVTTGNMDKSDNQENILTFFTMAPYNDEQWNQFNNYMEIQLERAEEGQTAPSAYEPYHGTHLDIYLDAPLGNNDWIDLIEGAVYRNGVKSDETYIVNGAVEMIEGANYIFVNTMTEPSKTETVYRRTIS